MGINHFNSLLLIQKSPSDSSSEQDHSKAAFSGGANAGLCTVGHGSGCSLLPLRSPGQWCTETQWNTNTCSFSFSVCKINFTNAIFEWDFQGKSSWAKLSKHSMTAPINPGLMISMEIIFCCTLCSMPCCCILKLLFSRKCKIYLQSIVILMGLNTVNLHAGTSGETQITSEAVFLSRLQAYPRPA